jgi:8-oxo-dGTP pyrophosphatase MutT (NUDIX family)
MHTSTITLALLRDNLPRILQGRKRKVVHSPELTPASILVPLFEKEGNAHLLLIKRSRHMQYHPYQISFPGGGLEESDSDLQEAALREAFEEIGVIPGSVEVLGLFDDYASTSNFRITPVLGIIPYPYPFIINSIEVERLVEVPLSVLLPQSRTKTIRVQGQERHTDIFQSGSYTIWGVTARIIKDLLDLLKKEIM